MNQQKSSFRLLPVLIGVAAVFWLAAACGIGEVCTKESPVLVSRANMSEEEYRRFDSQRLLTDYVMRRYEPILSRQPNVYDVSTGLLRDGHGGWTDTWGIIVRVTEKIDQSALPLEDRIPGYLEGIPVQVVDEEPLPAARQTTCDYKKCGANSPEMEEKMGTTPESRAARRHEVRLKYEPLFLRQPYFNGLGEGTFKDENGEWTDVHGIKVFVYKKVDQSTLPPEDRIPDCLEGVPVQILEEGGGIIIEPGAPPLSTEEGNNGD